ncbi:hypothetical protein PIROE2DRAFT_14317 [Piromyces sp. E2]|nr:hypothetical protein PIROE2DRAFT_14317 [Piromyces sp. E2]|eukprot:OUM60023.1 hypothetical protein PIROE2DRAFT_14317 [Piromyces sp. E2]
MKKNKTISIQLFIYFLLYHSVFANVINISNESEFLNILDSKDNQNEIHININSKISINKSFNITTSIKKISIIGYSREMSIIEFPNLSDILCFGKNVKEIELKDISFKGNIFFDNNSRVTLDSISFIGNINSNFDDNNNDYIKIKNSIYKAFSYKTNYCIYLGGNIEINNSKFYGDSSCFKNLFYFNGSNIYNLKLTNSFFSGEYKCSCLYIENGNKIDINSSLFSNGFVPKNLDEQGSGITIFHSYTQIKNSTFKNFYSEWSGGSLYLDNTYDFIGEDLEIHNSTAYEMGSMAFVTSDIKGKLPVKFKNIRQYNTGNLTTKRLEHGGLIIW